MTLLRNSSSVILKNVAKLISEKLPKERQQLVEEFSALLFENMSREDLDKRIDVDLYGASLSLFNAFNEASSNQPFINVFNPELGKYGWESEHTIVQIVVNDLPFLVDSVRMALNRLSITSHLLLHTPLKVNRNEQGEAEQFVSIKGADKSTHQQTVFLIEIDRQAEQSQLDHIKQELSSVLQDVSIAVEDWKPIQKKLSECIKEAQSAKVKNKQKLKSSLNFLNWVADHNYTLMGYREYTVTGVKGDTEIDGNDETSLGLMKHRPSQKRLLSALSDAGRAESLSDNLLVLTKTNSKSRVHRPAYIDYIGIKKFDDNGNVIGEHRFIGLYAASFYNSSVRDIPLLDDKIERITDNSTFAKGSHAYKALMNVLETYPRDELLQASDEHLNEVAMGVLQMQERDMTKLFIRKDTYDRFYSCMVFVRRERYNTQLRRDTQLILNEALATDGDVEFTTYFSESPLARTHYIVRANNNDVELNVKEIENNLIEAARTWDDKLASALTATFGGAKGKDLAARYNKAFPRGYKEEVLPSTATVDISYLEKLSDDNKLEMLFYRSQEAVDKNAVRLSLFHKDEPIHLSDVLPILENFGLRVIGETPYAVATESGENWVMDFTMMLTNGDNSDFEKTQQLFQQAFAAVWANRLENDGFNRLILGAKLSGREASVIRAYAKYMRQIGVTFSQAYIESTFDRYPEIAGKLVELFELKFKPGKDNTKKYDKKKDALLLDLDNVGNLDDDRIIRLYITLMDATLRTNFYQQKDGVDKSYISFKLLPELIPEVPLPRPKFEIFVYSPRIEGVHLRGGKVARGGLRWSDRMEDFRTEVLGLVKAQQVKNTVIVPNGSKGGFVCKQLDKVVGRDAFFAEGQECYRIFIRGLLDLTDNIVHGEVVPPKDVVRHDEDDTYLVVAADKGTATFSDIANAISDDYNFWLGDAFASGGSVGYDHKKMGITARGAWESVKRHFREMGIDCQTTDFTCVAVGDMAGDVFGNGMLLSKHIRLQAAFNHLHIFVDPNPDSAKTYPERERLFALPRSSWEDYNKELISQGGGIFSRSAKSIPLSPEMKKMLGSKKSSMTPNELIRAILTMQVDLVWNGGIGTYVKAKSETDAQVGDRANDPVRINGSELKAKVFGEGGNLGLTQLGRIEFAQSGGRINTDFVDNVGGVDCSDNEVNIKILLNQLVNEGDLTKKHRDQLLYDMTNDVSEIVLKDCYRQTHSISITELKGVSLVKEQIRFMHALEKSGKLDREIEFLPTDEELAERQAQGLGFTRPELSVLVAYGKMILKEQFAIDEIDQNPYYLPLLIEAFPPKLQEQYAKQIQQHPLRKEIIATKLANEVVNDMGLNFVERMKEETGANVEEILTCYMMARQVFDLPSKWAKIEELDNKIPAIVQTEMLHQIRRTVRRAARWFLRHRNKAKGLEETIEFYKSTFDQLAPALSNYLVKDEQDVLAQAQKDFVREGVSKDIASYVAQLSSMFSSMDIADVAHNLGKSVEQVSSVYFKLGSELGLHWFLDQITNQPVGNHWQALARASYREELDWQQRSLTSAVLHYKQDDDDALAMFTAWRDEFDDILVRWEHMLAEFKTSESHEFAKFSVALRELMLLSHHCESSIQ